MSTDRQRLLQELVLSAGRLYSDFVMTALR